MMRREVPMSIRPFRFLHASDLHLEQPLYGVAEVPPQLRDLFLDAPRIAAERVFDTAIAEGVDFVVLSGDVLHPQEAGPPGLDFLLAQFGRLHERGIDVFWAGGMVDPPERWPRELRLPERVHRFPSARVAWHTVARTDGELAVVAGRAPRRGMAIRSADYVPRRRGGYVVAAAYGKADTRLTDGSPVSFWALGGRHGRKTVASAPAVVHYPGSPQGRCPAETGPHGCTLVSVDAEGGTRTQLVTTDAVRWVDERIELPDGANRRDLEAQLRQRLQLLGEGLSGQHLVVRCTVLADGRLGRQLRRTALARELTDWLRHEFAGQTPGVWTAELQCQPAQIAAGGVPEDSLLADYLRICRQYEAQPDVALALDEFLPDRQLADELAGVLNLADRDERQRIVREAAVLGLDLLSGEPTDAPRGVRA
jgi:hypothetical protein